MEDQGGRDCTEIMITPDKIYVVHLDEAVEREPVIDEALTRLSEVDGYQDIPVEVVNKHKRSSGLIADSWHKRYSYYQATREHVDILENAWNDGHDVVLILEDDAVLSPNLKTELPLFLFDIEEHAPDWMMLFLGRCFQCKGTSITDNVILSKGGTGCHAYFVNLHGIWRVFDHMYCSNFKVIDHGYDVLMQSENLAYVPKHDLAKQKNGLKSYNWEHEKQNYPSNARF